MHGIHKQPDVVKQYVDRTVISVSFCRYIRMSPERFDHLLSLVSPCLANRSNRAREVISHAERLAVTLRYLATGDSQQSQSFNFRLGRATVSNMVKEVCQAIWIALKPIYLRTPQTPAEWQQLSRRFMDLWNFPNVLGAVDGKHIAMECPKNGGSLYYNYKQFHSTVLLAMCDADYNFVYTSIGSYGRDNDASIFSHSQFFCQFEEDGNNAPEPSDVNGQMLPYVILGDDAFPLRTWLMKPYPGRSLSRERLIFNYRLSRSRRTIENAFGVLTARWRIFKRPIRAHVTTVDLITKACLCLHNYLNLTDNAMYTPAGFIDCENESGAIRPGDWREVVAADKGALIPAARDRGRNYATDAKRTREQFCTFVNSEQGSLPWQTARVTNAGRLGQ